MSHWLLKSPRSRSEELGARKRQGAEPRFGPKRFPEVDFGPTLEVPTPEQGGDGTARTAVRADRAGMKATTGSMTIREEALESHGSLTTDLRQR